MRHWLRSFRHDERGTTGVEWAFVATILVLGAIAAAAISHQPPPMGPAERITAPAR